MKIVYGNYVCQEASTSLHIRSSTRWGQTGMPTIKHIAWDIWGYVRADSPSALTPLLVAHETAFSQHGQDIKLQNSGVDTAHVLLSSATMNGTRVSRFEWVRGNPPGAEYVNRRAWRATITAEVKATNSGLISWNESVRIVGTGGPVVIWQPTLNGYPVPQQTQPASTVLAFQRGTAVGISDYPDAALPLFSTLLLKSKPTSPIERVSPQQLGGSPYGWTTRWFYVFEGLGFSGVPVLP